MRAALALCAALCVAGPVPGGMGLTGLTGLALAAPAVSAKAAKKAKRYADKAKKAYKRGRWDDAISGFELAHAADPQPKYLFNIGRAYERKGDLFKAMEHVQTYVLLVSDDAEREDAPELYDILANKLAKSSGRLRLRSTPSEATVRLTGPMGELKGATPMDRWLEAGSWQLEVVKQGWPAQRRELVVEIGGELELKIELPETASIESRPPAEPPGASETPAVTEPEPELAAARPPSAMTEDPPGSVWPLVVLGVGAAAVATGAVMGLLARDKEAEVDGFRDTPRSGTRGEAKSAQDSAESRAMLANVLYGVGGAAAATGLVLWWTW